MELCLHAGNWSDALSRCDGCDDGWVGERCGTAVSDDLAFGFVAAVAVVVAAMLAGVLVIVMRCRWRPIVARGPLSMATGLLGGALWCYSAATPCADELLRPQELSGGGTAAAAADAEEQVRGFFWMSLVPGFGIWVACNLIYMRTMVQVHVFSRIPLIFPLQLIIALAPWIVVTHLQSNPGLAGVCGFLALHTFSLAWQLCKIWRDLLDVLPNLVGCFIGLAITAGKALGDIAAKDAPLPDSGKLAYVHASAVAMLVAVHFLAAAAPVLVMAMRGCCCCCPRDEEAEKRFYDEYTPMRMRSFAGAGARHVSEDLESGPSGTSIDAESYPYPDSRSPDPLRNTAPKIKHNKVVPESAAGAAARHKWERQAQKAAQDSMDQLVAERRQAHGDQSVISAVAGSIKPVGKVVDAARKSGTWLSGTKAVGTFRGTFGAEGKAGGVMEAIARYSFDRGAYGARQKGVTIRRGNGVQPYEVSPHGRLEPLDRTPNNIRKNWRDAQKQRVDEHSSGRKGAQATDDERGRAAILLEEQKRGPRSSEALRDLAKFRLGGQSRPKASAYDDVNVVRVGAGLDGTGGDLVAAVEKGGAMDILVVVDPRTIHR